MARALTPRAIAALEKALSDPDRAVQAAIALLDRGWGRPTQAITAQVDAHLTVGGVDAPTVSENYEAWLARAHAELIELEETKH